MKACGIVTEYNPFHLGHEYHIKKAREITACDVLVNVMSGNFVQRGEPAIIDKWERARTAILHGCDLVVELPYAYALQSADGFAKGSIATLALADVQDLVFGSETNDLSSLIAYADEPVTREKHRSLAASHQLHSNDILGIAYVKALTNTKIIPHTIQRTNHYHDTSLHDVIVSATAIREAIYTNKNIDRFTPMASKLTTTHQMEAYYPTLQYLLLTTPPKELASYFLMDEGIEYLLCAQAKKHTTMKGFVDACISKRYTRAKIQRTIIHVLTHTKKADIDACSPLQHLRILAMNTTGRSYLKQLKTQEVLIASKFNQIPLSYRELELRATHAYGIPLTTKQRLALLEKELQSPILVTP